MGKESQNAQSLEQDRSYHRAQRHVAYNALRASSDLGKRSLRRSTSTHPITGTSLAQPSEGAVNKRPLNRPSKWWRMLRPIGIALTRRSDPSPEPNERALAGDQSSAASKARSLASSIASRKTREWIALQTASAHLRGNNNRARLRRRLLRTMESRTTRKAQRRTTRTGTHHRVFQDARKCEATRILRATSLRSKSRPQGVALEKYSEQTAPLWR